MAPTEVSGGTTDVEPSELHQHRIGQSTDIGKPKIGKDEQVADDVRLKALQAIERRQIAVAHNNHLAIDALQGVKAPCAPNMMLRTCQS